MGSHKREKHIIEGHTKREYDWPLPNNIVIFSQ